MSTLQTVILAIVEIIIVFIFFGIWGKKFANRRVFLLAITLGFLIIDIVIGIILGVHG